MKLSRPSPALVVSIVALIVALGGTATAATLIGNKQLRSNAVTSAKIKNSSVQSADLKNGTVAVADLSKGTLKRIDGGGGGGSTAAATEVSRKAGPVDIGANAQVPVAKLTLQPGAYVVTAKTILSGRTEGNGLQQLLSSTDTAAGTCVLDVAGDQDLSTGNIIVRDRPAPSTLAMQLTRTIGATADATVLCSGIVPVSVTNTSIIATKVASVSKTDLPN